MEHTFQNSTWDQFEEKNKKRSGIITAVITALILLILLLIRWTYMWPPEQAGMVIDFGNMPTAAASANAQPVENISEEVTPPPTEAEPTPVEAAPTPVETQEVEEAPTVESTPDPVEETQPDPVETTPAPPKEEVPEPKEEAKPVEEPSKEETAPEPPKVDDRAIFPGSNNSGSQSSVDGDEGLYDGDQGAPDGQPNGNPTGGASGIGDFDLAGRGLLSRPDVKRDKLPETGIVKVEIRVDRNGKVISAKYTTKGSTTSHPTLIKIAEENAMKYKFTASQSAAIEQRGIITFNFDWE